MVAVKIDNKKYEVKQVSELTFKEFHDILIKGEAMDIPSYLSMFCDIPLKELRSSTLDIKGSYATLQKALFNVNIPNIIKTKRKTILYDDVYIPTDTLSIDTVHHQYYFEKAKYVLNEQKRDEFEMVMYALATSLLKIDDEDRIDDNNLAEIDRIYDKLSENKWMDVLPQGFFLLNKSKNRSYLLRKAWKIFTPVLIILRIHQSIYMIHLKQLDRRRLWSSYVRYSTALWQRCLGLT